MSGDRRALLKAALAGAVAPTFAGAGAAAAPRAAATGEVRGYAPGPLGQTHFRSQGEGPTVLLLHETPWSSHQYANVQPLLAAAGFRAIAADTPGYGMSPAPAAQPRLEDYVRQMIALLDAVGARSAAVVGDHTGAGVAILMAELYPQRVDRLALYGTPIYTDEERSARLANFARYAPPLVIKADGSHLSDRFKFVRQVMTGGVGSLEGVQDSTIAYMVAEDKRQMVLRALFEHAGLAQSLAHVRAPGLLLFSPDDSLHAGTARAHEARPDFRYVELAGGGPQLVFDRPQDWANAVAPFLRRPA
jgi:pimeloyl-ACP methyl ester carboxylesterase